MRTKFIIANWKENPDSLTVAKQLIEISENFHSNESDPQHIVVTHAVPNIFIGFLTSLYNTINTRPNIILQDVSIHMGGSHTGEISATQAKNLQINMSIVGHSETRLSPNNPHGDEDKDVNQKIKNLFQENMWACLCVGEYQRQEKDKESQKNYLNFIQNQLDNCLRDVPVGKLENLCIAYEPVWAIGKDAKRPATESEIVEVINFIKNYFAKNLLKEKLPKVLYGGSVDEKNAKEILNLPEVDGLLVGRASSDPEKWKLLLQSIVD